jgi:O-succinylbenzoic acid--CoA ligase
VSKGVELSAAALRHSARASLDRVGARPGERWLCCLPVTHVAGLQVLVRSLVGGTEPVLATSADAEALAASGCAHVSLVPTQLQRLLGHDGADQSTPLAGFSCVLLGGAAAPASLLAAARDAGVPVVTTYGMTETCGGCVYDGVPLDGVRAEVRDDGRIWLSGPVLFSGYRGGPRAPADGWFRTGDLGLLDAEGRARPGGRRHQHRRAQGGPGRGRGGAAELPGRPRGGGGGATRPGMGRTGRRGGGAGGPGRPADPGIAP